MKLLLAVIFLFLVTFNFSCNSQELNGKQPNESEYYTVKKIVDGDTFWIEDGTTRGRKIRLIGVDAPESRSTGRKRIGFYGKEAKAYLTELLSGKNVRLEFDVNNYDRYKRTLAYVYLEDGTFVNAELVKQGFAMVMTIPPNVKHSEKLLELQQHARENNNGLWRSN